MWLKESEYSNIPVVGISMGGTVALQLAIFHPEVVNSLILVSTFACLRPRNFHTASYLMRRFLKTAMRGGGSQAEMVAWHLFPRPEQDDLRMAMLQLIQETDPAIYKAAMRALAAFDVPDIFPAYVCRRWLFSASRTAPFRWITSATWSSTSPARDKSSFQARGMP